MTNSFTPARVLQAVGGIGMIIASFLQWQQTSVNGTDPDGQVLTVTNTLTGWDVGMLGLWQTLIGAAIVIAVLVAIVNPGALPNEIFGFRFEKALIVLAFPVLLWNFGLQFDDVLGGVGLLLGWIAAAITIAGSELQQSAFDKT